MAGEDCLKGRYPTLFHIARDRDAGVAYHVEIQNDECYWTPMFLCSTWLGNGSSGTDAGGSLHHKGPEWERWQVGVDPVNEQSFQMKSYTCIEGVTGRVPMEMYLESHVLSRVAFFSWCATLERVLTIYNLRKRGIIFTEWCFMCKSHGRMSVIYFYIVL